MTKGIKVGNIYSFFLAIIPIMNLYKSFIPRITSGEIVLIVFSLITIIIIIFQPELVSFGKNRINILPIYLFMTFLILTLVAMVVVGNERFSEIDVLNRFLRLALWTFSISFVGYFLFSYEITKIWLIRISVVATIYILFQLCMWHFLNLYLPSVISSGFIEPVSKGYADTAFLINHYTNFFYRPASFFAEPAYYSYYALAGLVLSLYDADKGSIIKKFVPGFISIGIVISTSTAGIYLMISVWVYYIYKNPKGRRFFGLLYENRLKVFSVTVIIVFILVVIYSLLNNASNVNDFFSKMLRIMSKPFDFVNSAHLGRSFMLFNRMEGVERFIGVGLGNEDVYLKLKETFYNSVTLILLSTGYTGLIAFLFFALRLVYRRTSAALNLAALYFLLCWTDSILYSSFSILYLTLILYMGKNKEPDIPSAGEMSTLK